MKNTKQKKLAGFTLVELIIVIVVITILAAAILVGIDPAKRFKQARNAQRWSEVNAILNAVMKYKVDNDGDLPTGVDGTIRQLGTAATACDTAPCATANDVCVDLTDSLVTTGGYLSEIPTDPNGGAAATTLYTIQSTASGGVKITACNAEDAASIYVQR